MGHPYHQNLSDPYQSLGDPYFVPGQADADRLLQLSFLFNMNMSEWAMIPFRGDYTSMLILLEAKVRLEAKNLGNFSSVAEPKLFISGSGFVQNFGSSYSYILPFKTVL